VRCRRLYAGVAWPQARRTGKTIKKPNERWAINLEDSKKRRGKWGLRPVSNV